jgi:hypothetical protein
MGVILCKEGVLRDMSRFEECAQRRCQHRAGYVVEFFEYLLRARRPAVGAADELDLDLCQ